MALLEPGIVVVVSEQTDGLAGFVMARVARRGPAHIITIDVLERFRRSGLGTQLMDETHRRLTASGARRVRLETAVDNAPAIAFYEKLGYSMGRRLKGYYLGKTDAWEMVKELNAE